MSWFTFRVYRELVGGAENAPISEPYDPIIEGIAEVLITDEKIVKSIRRYQGSDLIWFGEWTSPDGSLHTGGSNRTAAYKEVSSLIKQRAKLPEKTQKRSNSSVQQENFNAKTLSKAKGCLSIVIFALALPAVAFSLLQFGKYFL